MHDIDTQLPARLAQHISAETQFYALPGTFALESGVSLANVVVAYRTWGRLNRAGDNAVLVCHALTGSADVDAWWPGLIENGGALDPEQDFIVCSNILGSCYGTTGPVSRRPDGRRYRADFPEITVRDMVRLEKRLLEHLGVNRLALVTGPSLGGMQALEWAVSYPDFVASIVPIGVGVHHSSWCIAMNAAQRAAIYADPNWHGGYYTETAQPEQGLAAARMMAICGYRSSESFARRFPRTEGETGDDHPVISYLEHQGRKINHRFDANTYVRLTCAMNEFDLAAGRGSHEEVLGSIRQAALVVSVSSDLLYPPAEQAFIAEHLPQATYVTLQSEHGHDGFLIETAELGALIREFRWGLAAGEQLRRLKTA